MLRKNAYDLFLSLDDVEKIHESTLRVLKEVGVEFKHEEVLDVFKKHGARVENSIVYLDEDIINNALQTVPKSFELHGRAGFSTISVDGAPVITTAGGPPQLVHEDDSIRDSTLEDVIKFYKLIESSDVIDVTRIVSSDTADLDRNSENLFNPQQALLLKYNTKPVYGTIVNSNHTRGKSIRQGTRDSIQLIKKFYDVWDKNIIPVSYTHLDVYKRQSLLSHFFHSCFNNGLVSQVVMVSHIKVIVEFINQRNTGWDIDTHDLILRQVFKIFNQRADRVSVGYQQNAFALKHILFYHIFIIRDNASDRILQAFCQRQLAFFHISILLLQLWVSGVIRFQSRWTDVKGSAPDFDLFLSVFLCCLGLIQPLQSAIMAFVKLPVLYDWQPGPVHGIQNHV